MGLYSALARRWGDSILSWCIFWDFATMTYSAKNLRGLKWGFQEEW